MMSDRKWIDVESGRAPKAGLEESEVKSAAA
jgi:hypothetical protein